MTVKELVEKYPFIGIRSYNANLIEGTSWLDYIPDGWAKAFGERLAEDLNTALVKDGLTPTTFVIEEMKEKFGKLRVYSNGGDNVEQIVDAYADISSVVCTRCGKLPVARLTKGYVEPICKACYEAATGAEDYDKQADNSCKRRYICTILKGALFDNKED